MSGSAPIADMMMRGSGTTRGADFVAKVVDAFREQ